jgi:hypothetical protein
MKGKAESRRRAGLRQMIRTTASLFQRDGLDLTDQRLRIAVEFLHDLEHTIAPTGET